MRLRMRVTVPGAWAVNTACASGMASTVAEAITAASSAPVIAGATVICDWPTSCADMVTLSPGAAGLLSVWGAAGTG